MQIAMLKRMLNIFLLIAAFVTFGQLTFTVAQEATPEPEPLGGLQVTFDVDQTDVVNADDLRTTAEVIVRRLEGLEIKGYRVQIINGQSIQVQLPPLEDVDSILATISQTALLEFVDFAGLTEKLLQLESLTILTSEQASNGVDEGQLNPLTGEPFESILTGADIQSAQAEVSSYAPDIWTIVFALTDEAATIFGDFTEANIGEPLAIVLDGRVLSAPVIQMRLEADGVISGNFTKAEAEQLAAQLRAGALPLPLVLAEIASYETILLEE